MVDCRAEETLKNPECVVCKLLEELGVGAAAINQYHASEIGMGDFPPHIVAELTKLFESLDSNVHLVLRQTH